MFAALSSLVWRQTCFRCIASPAPRTFSSAAALVFDRHGDPSDVLRLQELPLSELGARDVLLTVLAAPINPSDINTIQGRYPLAPLLPRAVPGHEGVARVDAVGREVQHLAPGDHAVPLASALGTWRQRGVFAAADWHRVPHQLPLAAAATLCVNPPTALCMLESVVQLRPGDTVVQNGATSAVGQHVIQLARTMGLHTINVIRDRPDWDSTVAWLQGMGADLVTTEQRLKHDFAASGLPPPVLALNCVGGSSATAIAKILSHGATHVTYGAMSLQPLSPPTSLLIFKGISFRGFWISGGWAKAAGPVAHAALLDRVSGLLHFTLEQHAEALRASTEMHKRHKVVFVPSSSGAAGLGTCDPAR